MKSCIGKTSQVTSMVAQAVANGFNVDINAETVKISSPNINDGKPIYQALRKDKTHWIVRYDPECFA